MDTKEACMTMNSINELHLGIATHTGSMIQTVRMRRSPVPRLKPFGFRRLPALVPQHTERNENLMPMKVHPQEGRVGSVLHSVDMVMSDLPILRNNIPQVSRSDLVKTQWLPLSQVPDVGCKV